MRSNKRNANIAIGPGRIEQNCIIAAPHSHIDARLTELQVAQDDLIQKRRQARIAQPDFTIERIEFQAERSFEQCERRRAGPGLRQAGDG